MTELFALLPIVVLLFCMAGLGWTAARAGVLSAGVALGVAALVFGYDLDAIGLAGPLLEAGFTTATILWIIFPALTIHEFQLRSGASERIGSWLMSISGRPEVLALILAWFFALLLEGAAGFGTPIALVAPMLVALGYPALRALLLALIGHVAGVSFGAVGTPIVPLLEAYALDPRQLSVTIMLLHTLLAGVLVFILFRLAVQGHERRDRPAWGAVPAAAACFLLPALALAALTGPELPTLGGAMIGAMLFMALARWRWPPTDAQPAFTGRQIASAILPYVLVLIVILVTRTITGIATLLQSIVLRWELVERFSGAMSPLYHPGTMLMLAVAGTAIALSGSRRHMLPAMGAAAKRLPLVATALVSVLLVARLMVHSGMIAALAVAAAGLLGSAWPVAVPAVAALGAFITGSATASNILLAGFQVAAAEATGLAPLLALAGQGFGSAVGNVIAPHNIVAGAATVGLIGREGAVLKVTLPLCIVYAAAGGLVLFALARGW